MSSVLGSGYGYNAGGNQLRTELRTLTTQVSTLTTRVSSLKDLLLTLNPEKADAINAHFDNTSSNPQGTVATPVTPLPSRPPPANPAATRIRP